MSLVMLHPRKGGGGEVVFDEEEWMLILPAGPPRYRVAQLDDYGHLPRSRYPWRPPVYFSVEARITQANPPGTWGFGFWNDPFPLLAGATRRLPAFPQALWFFSASPPNHLSLHPEVPARGFFAGVTFWQGRVTDGFLLPLTLLLLPWPWLRDVARRWTARRMQQWGKPVPVDPTTWHRYTIHWETHRVRFWVDDRLLGESPFAPPGPLGLVLWVDNQYAAWPPGKVPRWGILPVSEEVRLFLRNLECRARAQ